ncbi:MAG: aspartyl protease family protein [Sphingomonadales bacterium]|jgi:predicted aspartyl protease|nr:aspartyl protease family protein [Sphingomonadales bacterium]MBK9002586.1 aspartyl protease family protein [Sphingomonadales bacterium]MBK9267806.1 aspartyl protease family protein [Sphingomonadales bacterium]MBP6433295.1 aspartyl protease family protein [Sphingorhabdus sp.]
MRHWLVTSIAALAAMPLWAFAGQETPQPSETPIIPELSVVQQFEIDRSDRMTVPVRINNSEPVDFIVDTGAERTVISGDLAQKLALEAGPELRLATITGPATAPSFYIEELALQSHKVEGIEAPALERGNLGGNGLLGIDSLEDSKVYLDFRTQHLEVLPSALGKRPGKLEQGMIVVSAKKRAGRMILSSAEVDGVKVDIILDTGAQASMGNFALRDRLRKRHLRFDYVPVKMKSVTGKELHGDFSQIKAIKIGSFDVQNLPVTFADNYAFHALKLTDRPAILFGMDALKLFDRVIIDFGNRRVAFDLPRGARRESASRLALASR